MKVKELILLLQSFSPDAGVAIYQEGSDYVNDWNEPVGYAELEKDGTVVLLGAGNNL